MTMMALAKTKLHLSIDLFTKDISLLELNKMMISINGQANSPIVAKIFGMAV